MSLTSPRKNYVDIVSARLPGEPPIAELLASLFVVGLGMLVDVYDVWLFTVVRQPSLVSLAVPQAKILASGLTLMNWQMSGMVCGAFLWGYAGDKWGRKSSLFGSIILYSLANLLNGFVNDLDSYAVLRFLAGIGLAGEVGAAMTIAAEITPTRYRAYGTGAVGAMAFAGSILAGLVGGILPWRLAFISAGLVGFLLLLMRMSVAESALFTRLCSIQENKQARGNLLLFLKPERLMRLLRCIGAGLPLWFGAGLIVGLAPQICHSTKPLSVATVALTYAVGQALGNVASSWLSQRWNNRRKVILLFLACAMAASSTCILVPSQFYIYGAAATGFFMGVFNLILTTTAEQFGTNIRATVSALVPNLVRASVIPMTMLYTLWQAPLGSHTAALAVGLLVFAPALGAVALMTETAGCRLDFAEER